MKKIIQIGVLVIFVIMNLSNTAWSETEKPTIEVGGAIRSIYAYKDFNETSKDKGGDFAFDQLRLNFNVSYKDVILSAQYRWFGFMHVIHHGWIGYNFSDNLQGQVGLTKVPFGILPYPDNNYWFGNQYYIGLADDYDMGVKFLYEKGPWDLQVAFFKNGEWGDASNTSRYSVDIATDSGISQANEETNQLNLRLANTIEYGSGNETEIGVSGMVGQLYNSTTNNMGDRWAAAAHLNGYYGPFNLMLEAAWYGFNPENPVGVDDNTVLLGSYGGTYQLASEGALYVVNLSYDLPVNWGPVSNLLFYNDYSIVVKRESGFFDSQINVPGVMLKAGAVETHFEVIMGKNAVFLGNDTNPLGMGNSNAEWQQRYNITIGYYF